MASNVTALMHATRSFMEGDMVESQVVELLARQDIDGWSVAGAKDAREGNQGGGGDMYDCDLVNSLGADGDGDAPRRKLTASQMEMRKWKAADKQAAAAAAAAANMMQGDSDMLYQAFKHFRENCNMMNIRWDVHGVVQYLGILLSDMKARVGTKHRDVRTMPLFEMTAGWSHWVLTKYRDEMAKPRNFVFEDNDLIVQQCRDLIGTCESLQGNFLDTRRLYVAAAGDLRHFLDDVEGVMSTGTPGTDRVIGSERTFAVEEDALSLSKCHSRQKRLTTLVDTLRVSQP